MKSPDVCACVVRPLLYSVQAGTVLTIPILAKLMHEILC